MNPQQTLIDIYNQIAFIREFACNDSIHEKDTILELPEFYNGTLARGLVLSNDMQIAFTYNASLQKILEDSDTWLDSKKRLLGSYANYLFSLLMEWKDRELNSFHLVTILNGILLEIAKKEKELAPSNSIIDIYGVEFGGREVLTNGAKIAVIDILEYPDFVGKEFYFSGSLPASLGITVTQGVYISVWSDLVGGYTQYRVRGLAPSLAIRLTQEDTRLLITAYDNISTRITIYE